jgi:hypothetical protein
LKTCKGEYWSASTKSPWVAKAHNVHHGYIGTAVCIIGQIFNARVIQVIGTDNFDFGGNAMMSGSPTFGFADVCNTVTN